MRRKQLRLPPPKTRHEALRALREALADGFVERTDYTKWRMAERKVDDADLLSVAKTGISWEGEFHVKTGDYRYRVEGYDGNRHTVAVVFEILGPKAVRLITVIRPRREPK